MSAAIATGTTLDAGSRVAARIKPPVPAAMRSGFPMTKPAARPIPPRIAAEAGGSGILAAPMPIANAQIADSGNSGAIVEAANDGIARRYAIAGYLARNGTRT